MYNTKFPILRISVSHPMSGLMEDREDFHYKNFSFTFVNKTSVVISNAIHMLFEIDTLLTTKFFKAGPGLFSFDRIFFFIGVVSFFVD